MDNIDSYSESRLKQNNTIRNYDRHEHGTVIKIKYDIVSNDTGARYGGIVGASVSPVIAFGMVAASIFFPVLAPAVVPVLVGSLLTPAAGAVTGALIGHYKSMEHYFFAPTGELLGTSYKEAAYEAKEKGLELRNHGDSKAAHQYSDAAYTLLSHFAC